MRDLVIVVSNSNKGVTPYQSIDAIKSAGFKNVFIQWYHRDREISEEDQYKYIKEKGLNITFAHLGYKGINDIWLETEEGDKLVDYYKNTLKECKEMGITLVVMHLTSHTEAPGPNEIGLRRIKAIVDYAKDLNIKVAFENTKIKGYLDYVIDYISNDNVGICLDVGHLHAHFNDELDFDKFKNRIFAVHLHDNHGELDEHLIPFDGTVNWDWAIEKLRECNYNGPITMEQSYGENYTNITLEEFYKRSHDIGQKLSIMIDGE